METSSKKVSILSRVDSGQQQTVKSSFDRAQDDDFSVLRVMYGQPAAAHRQSLILQGIYYVLYVFSLDRFLFRIKRACYILAKQYGGFIKEQEKGP